MKTQQSFLIACLFIASGTLHAASLNGVAVRDSVPIGTVFHEDGTIEFSDETIRLLSDRAYRNTVYPEQYDLNLVPDMLGSRQLLRALWILINVYPDDPGRVRAIAFRMTQYGIRGKDFLNAYYTYAFADPEVFAYGAQTITHLAHPDVMEEKLNSCKTIAAYTDRFLELASANSN